MRPERRLPVPLVAIMALALVLRLAWLWQFHYLNLETGVTLPPAEMAHELLAGHGLTADTQFMGWLGRLQNREGHLIDIKYGVNHYVPTASPTYEPIYLHQAGLTFIYAGVWKLTGNMRYIYIQLLQVILDLANVFLVFIIGKRLFRSQRVGLIASVLYAVFPKGIAYAAAPLDAWWVVTGLLLGITVFTSVIDDPHKLRRSMIVLGLIVGVFAWIRSDMILLPLAAGLAAVPLCGWRKSLGYGVLSAFIAYLVFAPWVVLDSNAAGTFLPFGRIGMGQNLYEGLGDMSNPYGIRADDGITYQQTRQEGYTAVYGTPAYDHLLLDKFISFVAQHPIFYLDELAHRASYSWLLPYGSHRTVIVSDFPAFARLVSLGSFVASLALGVLMFIGAWLGRRSIRRWGIVVIVGLLWFLILLPFHYQGRTTLPGVLAPNVLLAAYAISRGIDQWGPRRLRATVAPSDHTAVAEPAER